MGIETKDRIKQLRARLQSLKQYHPKDDDPTGQYYTVAEQRRSIRDKISRLKELS